MKYFCQVFSKALNLVSGKQFFFSIVYFNCLITFYLNKILKITNIAYTKPGKEKDKTKAISWCKKQVWALSALWISMRDHSVILGVGYMKVT